MSSGGIPCWQGLCGHTLSTRIEYDPVVSEWPPDLYSSRFKGPVMSAEIEVLTGALDSFSYCFNAGVMAPTVLCTHRVKTVWTGEQHGLRVGHV